MKIYIVQSYREKNELQEEVDKNKGINIVMTEDEFKGDLREFYILMFVIVSIVFIIGILIQ